MTRAEWEYRIERKSGSATWIFLFLQGQTLRPTNVSWSDLYCHRRAHGLSRSDPWRSQIKKWAVILPTGASDFKLPILHASRAISDQAYGAKGVGVSKPWPRKYFDPGELYMGLNNLRRPKISKKNCCCAFGAAPFAYPSKFIEGSWGPR